MQNIVVRGATGAEQSSVALKIPIEFSRVGNNPVDNRSRRTVATSVGVSRLPREETNVMSFCNDDDSDLGVDLEVRASSCGSR